MKRLLLAFSAFVLTVGLWELGCFLYPVRHQMDNPWYTFIGHDALSASRDLPFERPPHFTWTGSSRGDLAVLHKDRDPYAKKVTFKTDFQGFRNDTDIREADIIFIGDSYTEAGNIDTDKGFVQLVGQRLQRSVRNLGRAVYAPPHELVVLSKYGLPCKPKLVVWQIAEANDLNESAMYEGWRQSGRPYFESTGAGRTTPAEAWQRRSPTMRLVSMLRKPNPYPVTGTFSSKDGQRYPIRFFAALPGRAQTPRGHPGTPVMSRALDDGIQTLTEAGIPCIFLLIPTKHHVMADAVELAEHTRRNMDSYQPIPEQERMAAQLTMYFELKGTTFIDATQALKTAADEGELVYIPFDTHLNERGHKIVADLLVKSIAKMLPGPDQSITATP